MCLMWSTKYLTLFWTVHAPKLTLVLKSNVSFMWSFGFTQIQCVFFYHSHWRLHKQHICVTHKKVQILATFTCCGNIASVVKGNRAKPGSASQDEDGVTELFSTVLSYMTQICCYFTVIKQNLTEGDRQSAVLQFFTFALLSRSLCWPVNCKCCVL